MTAKVVKNLVIIAIKYTLYVVFFTYLQPAQFLCHHIPDKLTTVKAAPIIWLPATNYPCLICFLPQDVKRKRGQY
jgi:hypothetical protein